MSAHTKTHRIKKKTFEVAVIFSGKKRISHIPVEYAEKLDAFLDKYQENDFVDWKVVAKDSLAKHKQAGMVLRGARFRENMSQKKLAQLSKVSQENISRIENGKRAVGEKLAKKLAKPLKINYKLLLEDCSSK